MDLWAEQPFVCERFGAPLVRTDQEQIVGVAPNLDSGMLPVNGLRHRAEAGTSGWYLWAGEELSRDVDFFQPLHAVHLERVCSVAIPYLGLPPGWRFLLAGGYADVWYDPALLQV